MQILPDAERSANAAGPSSEVPTLYIKELENL
jgi:hypothetical protein